MGNLASLFPQHLPKVSDKNNRLEFTNDMGKNQVKMIETSTRERRASATRNPILLDTTHPSIKVPMTW